MTRWLRPTLYTLLLCIFCGVVFHAPLSVWLGTIWPEFAVPIKAWKEVLLMVAAVLLSVEVSRQKLWGRLLKDWPLRLIGAYTVLHLLLLTWHWQGVQAATAGLLIDLRFVALFAITYAACLVYPTLRRPLVTASVIAAALSILFAVLQVTVLPHDILASIGYDKATTIAPYLTVDQNYDYIRINGTLRGPNPLGLYAGIIAAACVAAFLMFRQRLVDWAPWAVAALAIGSLVAVWFSYSRSALVAAAIMIAAVVVIRYGRKVHKWVWLAAVAGSLLLVGGVYAAKDTAFVSHVILHEDPDEGNDVNSNDGHLSSLTDGTQRLMRQPLGAGIGSTGSPSLTGDTPLIIENYYLYVAHESGWIGLGLFISLFATVMWQLWRRRQDWLALSMLASGLGIAVAGLLLPVWADDTVALVWWGMAGAAIATAQIVRNGEAHGQTIK